MVCVIDMSNLFSNWSLASISPGIEVQTQAQVMHGDDDDVSASKYGC